MIQLQLPPIEIPAIVISKEINHKPFDYSLVKIYTIEEEKKDELQRNLYILYHQINEIEKYNDNGYIEYDQYKQTINQLLLEFQNYQSHQYYQSIKNELTRFVSSFPLAIKRIEVMKPNNCSCLNQIKNLIESKQNNKKIFSETIENQKYLNKLLYFTTRIDGTIVKELSEMQKRIDYLLNSNIIIPQKVIESIEKELLGLLSNYSI